MDDLIYTRMNIKQRSSNIVYVHHNKGNILFRLSFNGRQNTGHVYRPSVILGKNPGTSQPV